MSQILYYLPNWFSGYDVVLEVLFALVTLVVAIYALYVYKLSDQKESRLFGISFLLISISYSVWAVLNGFAVSRLDEVQSILDLQMINTLSLLGVYFHMLLFLGGVVTLTYMSLQIESTRTYSLISVLVILTALVVEEKYLIIYLLTSILLLFVVYGYIKEYKENQNRKVLLTLTAFIFLFLGRFGFMFSPQEPSFYVTGHLLELSAYVLILVSLISVVKHGQKKK